MFFFYFYLLSYFLIALSLFHRIRNIDTSGSGELSRAKLSLNGSKYCEKQY